jgi:hypothetical protein
VSWLRASRKVVDPDGVEWDVYVTRARQRGGPGALGRLRSLLPRGLTRRVEAMTDWPRPVKHVWQVEGPPGAILLNEIARGLALGKVPEPAGARYLGKEPYG